MLADEADATHPQTTADPAGNFDLTISTANLRLSGHDISKSQGNYDYHAHAQVYLGGADPLGSQGYASAVKNPSSSLDAAREAKSSRAFLFLGGDFMEGGTFSKIEGHRGRRKSRLQEISAGPVSAFCHSERSEESLCDRSKKEERFLGE